MSPDAPRPAHEDVALEANRPAGRVLAALLQQPPATAIPVPWRQQPTVR